MADNVPEGAPHTDHSLLRRLKAGEQDAATELYQRYAGHLRTLAASQTSPALSSRLDPDDIVQSVFRTFFRRVGKDQYIVPEGDDLWKLFLVIALHKIRNAAIHHRAAKRDVTQTVLIGENIRYISAAVMDDTGLTVLNLVIQEALNTLPEAARRIVALRIEGHGVAEIANETGRSKRSVERVLQQFRDEMRGLLDEDR